MLLLHANREKEEEVEQNPLPSSTHFLCTNSFNLKVTQSLERDRKCKKNTSCLSSRFVIPMEVRT